MRRRLKVLGGGDRHPVVFRVRKFRTVVAEKKFCPDIARTVDDHGDGGVKVSYERYFISTKIS